MKSSSLVAALFMELLAVAVMLGFYANGAESPKVESPSQTAGAVADLLPPPVEKIDGEKPGDDLPAALSKNAVQPDADPQAFGKAFWKLVDKPLDRALAIDE